MAVRVQPRLWTVDEYERMIACGVIKEDDRIELIEGEILQMSPIGSRHAAAVDRLAALFFESLRGRCIVRVQNPIQLPPRSEPQPDLTLLRPRDDFYASAHPGAADVLLAIEGADASLEYDRQVKIPVYARHGVIEAWLLDLEHDVVIVHREPRQDGYAVAQTLRRGEAVTPLMFSEQAIAIDALLG